MLSMNKARGILGASPPVRACGRQVSVSVRPRCVCMSGRGKAEPRDRSRGVGPRGRVPSWKGATRVREAQSTGRKY